MAAFQLSWLIIANLVTLLHSQSDTTVFEFTTFDGTEPNLIYQGDAHTTTRLYYNFPANLPFLRLTSANYSRLDWDPRPFPNSIGRVLYSPPVRLWDRAGRRQANFQTVIRGYIGNNYGGIIGDGLAFFVVPAVNATIPRGGHMGLYDPNSGVSPVPTLAAELDIFVNSWDPNYRHAGINVNSRTSEGVAPWDAGGFGRNYEVRVTYDARARLVSVLANASSTHSAIQPIIGRVEHALDLRSLLPEWVQIGISASTGDISASLHDVYRWSFTSFMVPDHDDAYIRQYV